MEEGSASSRRTLPDPPGRNSNPVEIDRDQARIELSFVMDERDRMGKQARMAAAERDRLADLLRTVETERDEAREGRTAAIAEQNRLAIETERLRSELDAAQCVIARAKDEIAWLRTLTEQLAVADSGREGDR
jgi:hypothetical protein